MRKPIKNTKKNNNEHPGSDVANNGPDSKLKPDINNNKTNATGIMKIKKRWRGGPET